MTALLAREMPGGGGRKSNASPGAGRWGPVREPPDEGGKYEWQTCKHSSSIDIGSETQISQSLGLVQSGSRWQVRVVGCTVTGPSICGQHHSIGNLPFL